MMPRKKHNCVVQNSLFSLVELIVVIAILFIMMGFGIAAYQGVRGHKSSEAGAQRVADMIALARQYAVLENTRVALLLPDKNSNLYDITASPKIYNKLPTVWASGHAPGIMMSVCKVDSSNKFVDWLHDGGWTLMPENSYFATSSLTEVKGIEYPDSSDSHRCNALIFQANGTLLHKMTGAIYVDPFSVKTNTYDPGKARQYELTLNWLTGQTTTTMKDR